MTDYFARIWKEFFCETSQSFPVDSCFLVIDTEFDELMKLSVVWIPRVTDVRVARRSFRQPPNIKLPV